MCREMILTSVSLSTSVSVNYTVGAKFPSRKAQSNFWYCSCMELSYRSIVLCVCVYFGGYKLSVCLSDLIVIV